MLTNPMLPPNLIFSTFNQAAKKQVVTLEKIRNQAGEIYAVLSYEPANNYLLMKWVGYSSEAEVKQASIKMMDWQLSEGLRKNCRIHVHDTKEIEGAWIGVVDWINQEMFPRCYQAGLRFNLSITSPDLFSKLSSVALQQQQSWQVPTLLFDSLHQAERWIVEHAKSL